MIATENGCIGGYSRERLLNNGKNHSPCYETESGAEGESAGGLPCSVHERLKLVANAPALSEYRYSYRVQTFSGETPFIRACV